MIVLQSTYDKALERAEVAERQLQEMTLLYAPLVSEAYQRTYGKQRYILTNEDIAKLISLCSSEKHNGNAISKEMTKKLWAMTSEGK